MRWGSGVRWPSESTSFTLLLLLQPSGSGLGNVVEHRQLLSGGCPLALLPQGLPWFHPALCPSCLPTEERGGVSLWQGIGPTLAADLPCISPCLDPAAQACPREGHHSRWLEISLTFWPLPPLPGEGAVAEAAGAALGAAVCVSSSRPVWSWAAVAVVGVEVGAAAAVVVAEGAAVAPPLPCGWQLQW